MAEDTDLARLFEALRREDEASAPRFAEVFAWRRTGPAAPVRGAVYRLAAVIVILGSLVVVALRLHLSREPEPPFPEKKATIAAWSSPTDWLLETPGRELLTEIPVLLHPPPGEASSRKTEEKPARTTPPKGDRS